MDRPIDEGEGIEVVAKSFAGLINSDAMNGPTAYPTSELGALRLPIFGRWQLDSGFPLRSGQAGIVVLHATVEAATDASGQTTTMVPALCCFPPVDRATAMTWAIVKEGLVLFHGHSLDRHLSARIHLVSVTHLACA